MLFLKAILGLMVFCCNLFHFYAAAHFTSAKFSALRPNFLVASPFKMRYDIVKPGCAFGKIWIGTSYDKERDVQFT